MSNQELMISSLSEKEQVKQWLNKIDRAERVYEPYHDLIEQTRNVYKSSQNNESGVSYTANAYNIFWSGIETQKPFLYFKRPYPYVERVNKLSTVTEQVACKILERALEWNLNHFDFDSVIKYARNDYLISGCGLLFESFEPEFQTVTLSGDSSEETADVVDREAVVTRYWDPSDFIADTDHVGVWEDVMWIARKMYLTSTEFQEKFGEEALDKCHFPVQDFAYEKSLCVYEIWDKKNKMIHYVSPQCPDSFIKSETDTLRLTGFFPCPKPLFATLTNNSLIPVPDYEMIRRMLDELNGITERMRLTMQAVKVSGVYDGAYHRLSDIFEKDVTLVSLADFDRLKANGGIRGVIDFIPIEQYITALEQLARRREDIVQRIFEITGVSDIMRGNSNAVETATAVEKKTNFGTLRNQERQNDMQRFICDLYRLKAEMICVYCSEETLMSFVNPSEGYSDEVIRQAVRLLKEDRLRDMIFHVETSGILNPQRESSLTMQGVETIMRLVKEAVPLVSQQPLLLPLFRHLIQAVVGQMPHARTFESVLDQTFAQIKEDLAKPIEPDMRAEAERNRLQAKQEEMEAQARAKVQFEQNMMVQKAQQSYELEKEKNMLKEREIRLKENEVQLKNALSQRELDVQYKLKHEALVRGKNPF